jgi:hypothetical protein
MSAKKRDECERLRLQIERDAISLGHLRALVTDARHAIAGHREELRILETPRERGRHRTGC